MQTFLYVGHSRSSLPALHLNPLPPRTTVRQVWTVSETGRVDEDDTDVKKNTLCFLSDHRRGVGVSRK